jgi:tRNA-dihydrouridine synthase B
VQAVFAVGLAGRALGQTSFRNPLNTRPHEQIPGTAGRLNLLAKALPFRVILHGPPPTGIRCATVQIGPYQLTGRVLLAPMAGVSDRPFRVLCRRHGAALAVTEMTSSRPELLESRNTRRRRDLDGEPGPRSVQLVGSEPEWLAEAARYNVDAGADIIDINMGCPAKKVCQRAAGSALLADEALVGRILDAVVGAVEVPVTLKIRTGPDRANRNALRIARLAEAAGIQSLVVHGRTRADAFRGEAEYQTIAEVKSSVGIPVVANGDIRTPEDAARVLASTGADAVMIGRAAQGDPFLFDRIEQHLAGRQPVPVAAALRHAVMAEHLAGLYELYGAGLGARVARKHLSWYLAREPGGEAVRNHVVTLERPDEQLAALAEFFTGEVRRAA